MLNDCKYCTNFAIVLLYIYLLFSVFDVIGQGANETYDLTKHYPNNRGLEPIFIGESPMNEATVQVFADGIIKIYHTPERYSDKVLSIKSTDNGYTWSAPKLELKDEVIWQYPRRTLIDQNGDLHLLVFKRENNDVLHTKTSNNGKSWSPFVKIADGRIGAIRGFLQTGSGRLIFGFHRSIAERKPPYGQCFTSSVYSDDGGATWIESSSKILAPVYEGYIGNNYGFVEPNIVELKDGRIWLVGRTQTDYLYQSFSSDQGESWSEGEASIFHSSNSPANILKLPDGRLVLTWCNTVDTDINDFGRIYTHRDVLHMAISDDDGHTWRGFREIIRIPSRNDQNDMPSGDSGTSYPNAAYSKEGKILLVTGQGEHGGGKSIWIVDPEWLYETKQEEDFLNGLEKWSAYTFSKVRKKPGRILGPHLIDDASAKGGKVLHIRKSDPVLFGDAAVWNFPMGRIGSIEMKIKMPVNSKGTLISLTDCHRHPNDPNGYKNAMFSFLLAENGAIDLKPDKWHLLKLQWNLDARNCEVYIDNEFNTNVPLINESSMGISYIRFNSSVQMGQVDSAGLMLDWIKSVSNSPYSENAF